MRNMERMRKTMSDGATISMPAHMHGQPPQAQDGLQQRFIQTELAKYRIRQVFDGVNRSGRRPVNDLVVVMLDDVLKVTLGGIELPEDYIERMNLAAETGVVVAVGPGAFKWSADRRRPFEGEPPRPGDRVQIDRYAGALITGKDGQKYRLVPDRQIGALLDEDVSNV